jgi:Na+-transporting NADH:ubiquinone oxidoreductase subunit B
MKWLMNIFDQVRPLFDKKKGKLKVLNVVFETAEYIFFYPSDRTKNAPHVRDPLDIKRFMGVVILAMLPCVLGSIYFFGPYVIAMILVSYIAGGICG